MTGGLQSNRTAGGSWSGSRDFAAVRFRSVLQSATT